jgi:hypothetical protein
MFGPLKEASHVRRFASGDDVKDAMHKWLRSESKTFFADGIKRLVSCYTICVEKRGDYVEKWYILLLSQVVVHEVINKSTLFFDSILYIKCIWTHFIYVWLYAYTYHSINIDM